jgi:lipopolysaccharide transport system ATP-binding protein
MIMDEVLAVGDMAFQKKCIDKMKEAANQEGRTVLYVSHNMNTIRKLCDRCVVLDKGKIIYDGDVESAIHIYMDNSIEEYAVDMDLAGKPHAGIDIDMGLYMEHLILVDKVMPIYDGEEPLKLRLRLKITKPLSNVRFRLTLRTETDDAIGTAWTEPMTFSEASEHVEVNFSLRLDSLERGIFYASIGFYQTDDFGKLICLDHITRAFQIEIVPKIIAPYWRAEAYGYVKLPQIDII